MHAGTLGEGIFKSIDGGASWSAVNAGLTQTWLYSLAINPARSGTVYAGTGGRGVFVTISMAPGDFNQDGNSDILWRHTVSGDVKVWFMNGVLFTTDAWLPRVADLQWKIFGPR